MKSMGWKIVDCLATLAMTHFGIFCEIIKFDGLVKSLKMPFSVIPAKAGIQLFQDVLDPGFRRGDASRYFLRVHQG
jgi:hypothetical protein